MQAGIISACRQRTCALCRSDLWNDGPWGQDIRVRLSQADHSAATRQGVGRRDALLGRLALLPARSNQVSFRGRVVPVRRLARQRVGNDDSLCRAGVREHWIRCKRGAC